MSDREKVSEWWEVWICAPGQPPVRPNRYGMAVDFRIPHEGHPTREGARAQACGDERHECSATDYDDASERGITCGCIMFEAVATDTRSVTKGGSDG